MFGKRKTDDERLRDDLRKADDFLFDAIEAMQMAGAGRTKGYNHGGYAKGLGYILSSAEGGWPNPNDDPLYDQIKRRLEEAMFETYEASCRKSEPFRIETPLGGRQVATDKRAALYTFIALVNIASRWLERAHLVGCFDGWGEGDEHRRSRASHLEKRSVGSFQSNATIMYETVTKSLSLANFLACLHLAPRKHWPTWEAESLDN